MAGAEVEVAVVTNGSGPPEDRGAETVPENKGGEEMKVDEEGKDQEEKKDGEENKDGEQNGERREEDKEGEKKENKSEDVDMTEAEDVKDVEKAGKGGEEEEGEKLDKESEVKEEKESMNVEEKVDDNEEEEVLKRKRGRGQKVGKKGDTKEKKERGMKVKLSPSTPVPSTIERPVRERKTVERLVEVIEKEPDKGFQIEKGHGTPLKDIPNVAYKLARKKPADLKLLHQTLFGRRGKVINYKNHILQFSGFSWHENDEKQRAKVKDKLDKYVKDSLLDICDLFDIPVAKATTKKEDLVVKLLDFMVAPCATTDVILAEKDQSSKSRKRKRVAKGSASKSTGDMSVKRSRKKSTKGEGTPNTKGKRAEETEDEDEEEDENDNENGVRDEDEALSDEKEKESEEEDEDDEDSKIGKRDTKISSKNRASSRKEMKVVTSPKKASFTTTKTPSKSSSSKHWAEESNDVGAKVFSRKKKNVDVQKTKSNSKPEKKEKGAGKRMVSGKGKSEEAKQSGPSKDELRKTICEILKEVDFNTATFTDILKQLASHYKMDLTSRKSAIKLMIQEELTKLADAAEENEDEEEDAEKGDSPKPTDKELEA